MPGSKRAICFLVLLIYYVSVCIFFAQRPLKDDEWRYRGYAINLTRGFYAPSDTKHLWNGPGYPLFLSVFVLSKASLVAAKYFNVFFLFAAVIFFYMTLCYYVDKKRAFWCAMILGLYPPLLPELPRLLTESMSVFLVAGFAYFAVRSFKEKKIKNLLIACLFGAYLMLTKVVYAYVVAGTLVISLPVCFWRRDFLRAAVICAGCLVFCLPYLFYTYSLTGKFFYWGNSGGTVLHCMSRPSANEWGDWFNTREIFEDDRLSHHRPFFETLQDRDYVEQDRLFKQEAIRNIRRHPFNYAMNWISNVGRMWFDYPFAYKYQRPHTLFYMFPNALLLSAVLFSVFPLLKSVRRTPSEILMLGILAIVFILGSSVIYTCSRYLVSIVPVLLVLVFYCWGGALEIRWKDPQPQL
jgi:hypothetical protein